GILLSVCSFNIPFTYYKFNGFANSIKLGLDLKGGVEAVYEAKVSDGASAAGFDESLNATIKRISDLITSKGYTEATVTKQNSDRIRVEVPDVADPTDVLKMIGEPAKLAIRKTTLKEDPNSEALITGHNIKSAEAGYQDGKWGVSITFDAKGAEIFKDLTTELAGTDKPIHIYLGTSDVPFSSPTVNEAISGGTTFISGSMSNQTEAEEYALKILSGTFGVDLKLISNNVVSATLGKDALLYGIIAGIIGFVFILVFMGVVYKEFGILANLSLIFYTIILLFLLQAVPFVQLTLPGIAGIILSLGMAVDGNVIIFERIKDEYRSGKKIPICVKSGYKRAASSILDSNITTIIAALVLYFLGNGAIKGFAVTLFLGIVVSMFTSLLMTKTFTRWYMEINSKNPKRLGLLREDGINEIG
ncbi:MAG: protein translocase subunit SecD, partial [Clostridia bacterium]